MVGITEYIPVPGDVVWLNFNPQAGHEHSGRRPAVTLSLWSYNSGTQNLGVFCPITTKIRNNPFEVAIPDDLPVSGIILDDQIRSMDWRTRNAEFICTLPNETVDEVLDLIVTLLQL